MGVRSLNGLDSNTTNVYINTNLSATEPVVVNQSSFNNPITVSLNGLSGFGTAGQVIKVNSTADSLEYADDNNTQEWTLNSGNLYPNATATDVIIGNTTNLSNRKLYVDGDTELTGKLYFNNGDIFIENSSGYLQYNTEYKTDQPGGAHQFRIENSVGTLTTALEVSTRGLNIYGRSDNPNANEISLINAGLNYFILNNEGTNGGSPYVDFNTIKSSGANDYYYRWRLEGTEYMRLTTNGLEGSNLYWKAQPIAEIYGGTNQSSYTTGDILYASATNTLAKLSIGSSGQVLQVSSGGIVEWADSSTVDLTTSTNFGTAVSGGNTIKLGNSAGTSQTTNLELYTSATLKIFNTSNVEVARFTPQSNTCNLTLNGGVITTATLSTNTTWNGNTIAYNYGGTGLSSLTADKILQVNSTATGYNLIDLPASTTQYWSLSSSVLSPINSGYAIRGESGFRVGATGEFVDIDYNTTTNVFSIDHSAGNLIFEYDDNNGYITWGTIAGARMDFNNYILHGADTAYPSGVSMPFGTIGSIYVSSAYIRSITTDEVAISEYQGSPASTSSTIRVNSSSEIYFTSDKLKIANIHGTSNSNNKIVEEPSYGWSIRGSNNLYGLNFYNGTSYYPFLGTAGSGNQVFNIHINAITGGNAYYINNTTNTQNGLVHTLTGDLVRAANMRVGLSYSSSYGRIYNPSGTNSSATDLAGAHIFYHDNGTFLGLNMPNTTYASSNSNNMKIYSGGSIRVAFNGSENPAMSLYQTNGSTIYGNIGRASTFPANMGQWSSVAVPSQLASGGNVMYMGGSNTNDSEGFWFCNSGNSGGFSNPGDNNTIWWFDEDNTGGTYWAITPSGTFTTSSDRRIKDNINTFKDSDFEKYKKIRIITYTQKIPENINPKRLEKQSCIDKYNKIHYGVVAQELYDIYPELEDTKERDDWIYRRDNWDNGIYEKEHNKWLEEKEKYECCDQKDCEDKCEYKTPEPQKEFNEEEPIRSVEYQRLSLLTIGVVQDLITENEKLKEEVNTYKAIVDKLIKAPSFKAFKESLA